MAPGVRDVAVAVLVLCAPLTREAIAAPPVPESDIPPFVLSPEPGIFDTLPGPPTTPRAFASIDILVPSAPPPGPPVLEATGVLEDVSEGEIRVDRGPAGPDMLIALEPDTFLYLDGEPASWRELPAGADVLVEYELRGNERTARRVRVTAGESTP